MIHTLQAQKKMKILFLQCSHNGFQSDMGSFSATGLQPSEALEKTFQAEAEVAEAEEDVRPISFF